MVATVILLALLFETGIITVKPEGICQMTDTYTLQGKVFEYDNWYNCVD